MTTYPIPEEGGSYARLAMREAFSVAVDELERFLSRLTRNDARLVLERESKDMWIVVDVANPVLSERDSRAMDAFQEGSSRRAWTGVSEINERELTLSDPNRASRSESTEPLVMLRTPERLTAVRFMRRFAILTDGASLDEVSISGSVGVGGTDGGLSPAPADSTQRLRLVL